jgi:riboflavin synthase
MFTGIVTAIGEVAAIVPFGAGRDMTLRIAAPAEFLEGVRIGASIACSGCCLTAVALAEEEFAVEVSAETLSKTTLGGWSVGSPVNLERALRVGDELGGHIVSGHVDGVGTLMSAVLENGSRRLQFRAPDALARYIAPKGSIAVEGVSLTVNDVQGAVFGVNIIPHTETATMLGRLVPGDGVNLEIDMLARYVARLRDAE